MRLTDDFKNTHFARLIKSGRLYECLGAAEAGDHADLLERAPLIDGVEVIGGSAYHLAGDGSAAPTHAPGGGSGISP